MFPRPIVDPAISMIAPSFRAVSLFVDAHNAATMPLDSAVLADACRAVQEGVRAVDHFDALEEFGREVLAGQQAVEAVVGHVVGVHREAAHDVELLVVAEAAGHAHGRVVLQHVGDALRLVGGGTGGGSRRRSTALTGR